jgi:hypothetical protein
MLPFFRPKASDLDNSSLSLFLDTDLVLPSWVIIFGRYHLHVSTTCPYHICVFPFHFPIMLDNMFEQKRKAVVKDEFGFLLLIGHFLRHSKNLLM